MATVPSNLIPVSITQLPVPVTPASEDTLLVGVYQGVTYKIRAGDLLQVAGVPTSRQVIAGTGLTGGGALSSNVTLSVAVGGIGTTQLAASGVTPGVYGDGTNVPQFTVDATGRVMAATSVPISISGYVPTTREVIAGNGLTGGGALSSNVTLAVNYGSTPLTGTGTGSAGSALTLSRSDHRHPAVDLADQTQIDGILPIDQGGTGRSLVMQPGAVMWSGSDGLYVGPVGTSGQVLVSGGTGAPTWGSTLIVAPVAANTFFAGPTAGSAADPVFRAMVNADLPASGAVAATYGSGALVPVLVVNNKGVITSASSTAVTPAWSNVTGTPTTIAGYGITDGVTLTGAQALTNKTIDASLNTLSNIPNAALSFSSVTINGSSVSLGGSITVTATASQALTIGTGLSGTSYNGSTAVTIANTGVLSWSGGTTGLTPATATTGAVTLAGTLVVANGGTGATTAAGAPFALKGANSDITSLSGITGSISTVDTISFDTSYATTLSAGQLGWDGNNTLGLGMYGGNVVQRIGEDVYYYIKASSAITHGQLVMFTGAVGASGVITGAPATGLTDGQYIMGIASESIALNGFGLVQHFGTVRGINTTGSSVGETWVDGQILYYNPNYAGGLTNTQPTAPNVKATIAVVTNAGNGGSGSLFVRPSTGSVLGGTDSNVQFSSLSNLDVVQYDSTLQYWKNVPASGLSVGYATQAGSVVNALTAGTYLTSGGTYNGSVARTFAVDATDANTASKVVARDASGNFAAGTITAALSGNATTATTATNLAGGAASQIPYQTGAGATGFIANGTAGQVLTSAGSGTPVWSGISGGTF